MKSEEALKKLLDGNKRYVAGTPKNTVVSDELRVNLYKNGQRPYAAILGCSDSRVPVETIFDAGPGELFVIRTAGNVASQFDIGSIEYAVMALKVPLVLVLGHQKCGAVRAALEGGEFTQPIEAIAKEIISCMPELPFGDDKHTVLENANIRHTMSKIAASPYIAKTVSEGALRLAAAKYSLETGKVSFFE